tara:strand:- start:315 stop:509 length:195 start_codon:yes stop_codon:yes gene_type:complete
MGKIEIARKARQANITASRACLAKTVAKIDTVRSGGDITVTQACRDANISTERYYRFKRMDKGI